VHRAAGCAFPAPEVMASHFLPPILQQLAEQQSAAAL
jgi:hypothetical protein